MTRLNLILFFALIFSALGLVNAQHHARKLYIELEQLNQAEKQYNQEYGQLQLEQSTWAMHSRIEQIATQQLQMQVPDAKRIQIVGIDDVAKKQQSGAEPAVLSDKEIKTETDLPKAQGAKASVPSSSVKLQSGVAQ